MIIEYLPDIEFSRCIGKIYVRSLSFLFEEDDVCNYFNILKPDCFTIGEESVELFHREIDSAYLSGSQVHVIKRVGDFSSTNIVNKIREDKA